MAKATKPRNLGHLRRDRGYRFKEQDPAMVELCAFITDSGKSITSIVEAVKKESHGQCSLSPTTVSNWLSGKTRRPQNYTLNWVGFSLGYSRVWTEMK